MKSLIICDSHWGARNDHVDIRDHQIKFHEKVLLPYLRTSGIKTIFHLGDLLDRRRYVNFVSQSAMNKHFLDPISQMGIEMHILVGNHDTPHRNTNDGHALGLLLKGYPNIKIYQEPENIAVGGQMILMVPWIPEDKNSQRRAFNSIKNSPSKICMGHLELAGFLNNDDEKLQGLSAEHFSHFDIVLTGHYQNKRTQYNVHYLGSPYMMTWGEAKADKGVHVFDLETRTIDAFVKNPYPLFQTLDYDDEAWTLKQMIKHAKEANLEGAFVRIIVRNKTNANVLRQLITELSDIGMAELKVVDTTVMAQMDLEHHESLIANPEDTPSFIRRMCKDYPNQEADLVKLLDDLYKSSMNLKEVDV